MLQIIYMPFWAVKDWNDIRLTSLHCDIYCTGKPKMLSGVLGLVCCSENWSNSKVASNRSVRSHF